MLKLVIQKNKALSFLRSIGIAPSRFVGAGALGLIIAIASLSTHSLLAQQREPWTISWASSQMQPYGAENLPAGTLNGVTLRQVVHLSVGGTAIRVRIANTFGNEPLNLRSVHVALRGAASGASAATVVAGSDHVITFQGQKLTSVPAGAECISDPIPMAARPLSDLVISMFVESAPESITFHAGAHATSFLASGDHVADVSLAASQTFTRWYFLSGVEVNADRRDGGAIIALGDSITDGHGSTTDGNDRWPDVLARRLGGPGSKHPMAIVNEGIGGNCVLRQCLGPSVLARFNRDVLSQANARAVILMEGINDLGGLDRLEAHPAADHAALVVALELAMTQMAAAAHEHGLRFFVATLTPYLDSDYYHPSASSEADRQAMNGWIRKSTVFDGIIDFDEALRDPARPDHMATAYDSGDHLHPGPAGYRRMAEAVPLSYFKAK